MRWIELPYVLQGQEADLGQAAKPRPRGGYDQNLKHQEEEAPPLDLTQQITFIMAVTITKILPCSTFPLGASSSRNHHPMKIKSTAVSCFPFAPTPSS